MNKKYIDPEMNITLFKLSDVITASGIPDDLDDLYSNQDNNDTGNND